MTHRELVDALVENGAGDRRHVTNMLKHLSAVVANAVGQGEDVVVPGLAKIYWAYRKPLKRGERWKKGDEVTGFGGISSVKDADSPPVKPQATLKVAVVGAVAKHKPGRKPEVQAEFLKSRTGRVIARRKG